MNNFRPGQSLHTFLETCYAKFNHARFRATDPVRFLYRYRHPLDREVVAFLSSAFAFGRVRQIFTTLEKILARLGPHPASSLRNRSFTRHDWSDCVHRFASPACVRSFLQALSTVLQREGSLQSAFLKHWHPDQDTVLPALAEFVREFGLNRHPLLPCASLNSACKRLHLFLRWMVRKDAIDPGLWHTIPPRALIVPLDTHMARIATLLGLTHLKTPGRTMAVEITDHFRQFCPDDPVRYDFALTRLGMLNRNPTLPFAR